MPELPEISSASRFINRIAAGRLFKGPFSTSKASTGKKKMQPIAWTKKLFTIRSGYRGKEMQMVLEEAEGSSSDTVAGTSTSAPDDHPTSLTLTFNFGMSGKFSFDRFDQIPQHAHLMVSTADSPVHVLSYVDYRRFGGWREGDFDFARGPCPVQDYDNFRQKVLSSLDKSPFNKPICETIMNQDFFNGIGNYLRAEILFRAKIPPFDQARQVLEILPPEHALNLEEPDLLDLCNLVPREVFELTKPGEGYNPNSELEIYAPFKKWLRCYMRPDMNNLTDHNKRTMWFTGPPGQMKPSNSQSRHRGRGRKKKDEDEEEDGEATEGDDLEKSQMSDLDGKDMKTEDLSLVNKREKAPGSIRPKKSRAKKRAARTEDVSVADIKTEPASNSVSPRKSRTKRKDAKTEHLAPTDNKTEEAPVTAAPKKNRGKKAAPDATDSSSTPPEPKSNAEDNQASTSKLAEAERAKMNVKDDIASSSTKTEPSRSYQPPVDSTMVIRGVNSSSRLREEKLSATSESDKAAEEQADAKQTGHDRKTNGKPTKKPKTKPAPKTDRQTGEMDEMGKGESESSVKRPNAAGDLPNASTSASTFALPKRGRKRKVDAELETDGVEVPAKGGEKVAKIEAETPAAAVDRSRSGLRRSGRMKK